LSSANQCTEFNVPLDTPGHFGDETFQAFSYTGTDNQKHDNQEKNRQKIGKPSHGCTNHGQFGSELTSGYL